MEKEEKEGLKKYIQDAIVRLGYDVEEMVKKLENQGELELNNQTYVVVCFDVLDKQQAIWQDAFLTMYREIQELKKDGKNKV